MRPRISIIGWVRPSVGPSVRPSVRPSVGPSVTPVQKPRFSAVFGHGEILHWNKWSTNMFWEPPLLLSRFTRLFVHLSLRICHMINTRRDTVRTHLCPVGLVLFLPFFPFSSFSTEIFRHISSLSEKRRFPLLQNMNAWWLHRWWFSNQRTLSHHFSI